VLEKEVENVPPHTVAVVLATVSPVGSVSENATPTSAVDGLGLVIVKVRLVVALRGMLEGLNTLLMLGANGIVTVRFAVAKLPVPPLVDVTTPVELEYWPMAVAVTLTENWHCEFAAIEEPVN